MKKSNQYLAGFSLIAALMVVNTDVLAANEAQYHFLPTDTVVNNIKTSLESHGIDPSSMHIDVDTEGVVKLSGEVASKQQADIVTRLTMHADGVYAVLGDLRYDTPALESSEAPAVPAGMDPVMDSVPVEEEATLRN